jgi:putative membrane protein
VFFFFSFGIQTNLFFMGLILGGIPLIAKLATENEKVKPICIVPFLFGFALVFSLFLMERSGMMGSDMVKEFSIVFFIRIFIYAFVAAAAMIMPGISGAFVLLAFGAYDMFIEALIGFDFVVLVPAVIGVLAGIVAGAKLVLLAIRKFRLMVYSAIMGMVIGSVAPLFPEGAGFNLATLVGVACMGLGGWLTVVMGKREGNKDASA